MVFPLYDDNTGRRTAPGVNYVLIAINIFVFVFFQRLGSNDKFTYAFSTVPYEIVHNEDLHESIPIVDRRTHREVGTIELEPTPISVYLTLLTSMFMHGS